MHARNKENLPALKVVKDALRESQASCRHIFENGSDAVLLLEEATGRILAVNPAAADLFGYSQKEFPALTLADVVAADSAGERPRPDDQQSIQVQGGRRQGYFRKKDGSIFLAECHPASYASGGRRRMIALVRDISAHELASKKLKESEERYRSLVDHIAIGVTLISPVMEILTLNNQMRKWYPHIDPAARPICYRSFNHPPRQGVCSYCPTVLTLSDGQVHESVTMTPAGDEIRNFRIISSPIKDDQGNVAAAIEMVEDITEPLQAQEQVRTLSQQLLRAQETERRMISFELHDRIAQNLSALKISSDMFAEDLRSRLSPLDQLIQQMPKYSRLIEETIAAVRSLAYELQPVGLYEMGIVKALETYCSEFSETSGIQVAFHSAGMQAVKPDPEISIQIYRLVQEGLNNIKKHAEASHATIRLIGVSPHIIVRIEDDGIGFDVEARERLLTREKRMGLRSMRERTHLLAGQMTLRSRPTAGTQVVIKIPLKEPADGSEKTHYHY